MNEHIDEIRLPRETTVLFGHAAAERALLAAYQSARMPHAWLIGGEPGIGKATLAYRFARFVLAYPDPGIREVRQADSLGVEFDHPVARRIAAQAQPDLLALERSFNEQTGKLYSVIRVDDVRRTVSFFGSTAGAGGWRIAIVDAIDDLQREGANALLKVLEEPPARALILLVSHRPGRELPTLRSRCRRLLLRPLAAGDVAYAVAAAIGYGVEEARVQEAAAASGGSVARALTLLDADARSLRQRVVDLIAQLPEPEPRALHALADTLGGSDPRTLASFMDLVNGYLAGRLGGGVGRLAQMARVAEIWERINRAAREVEIYNLERKPLVFAVFGALAEVAKL